jgi:hypothetical protein
LTAFFDRLFDLPKRTWPTEGLVRPKDLVDLSAVFTAVFSAVLRLFFSRFAAVF